MARSKKSNREQVQENYPEFATEVEGLSADQLNNKLATLAKYAEETETAKEDDEALEQAKAEAAELAAPYRDAKKAIRAKSKYVIALLKEKGGE